jgi:lysine-specific demethylase 3
VHNISHLQTSKRNITNHEKVRHLHYLIKSLLPFLEQICDEQTEEVQIEAGIGGILCSLLQNLM